MLGKKNKNQSEEPEKVEKLEHAEGAEQETKAEPEPEQPEKTDEPNPLEAELEKQKELYLRLAAEYENFRKRTQREKEALGAEINAACVGELLPVLDNLERALAADHPSAEDMRQGVGMVLNQAAQIFEKLGAVSFGAPGEPFNPNYHHCIGTAKSEEIPSGAITVVIQKGYLLGDRVIRPAMVQVAE